MGTLYIFDEVENGQKGFVIESPPPPEQSESVYSVTGSTTTMPTTAATRLPDLPVRELTQYVDTLIGTEGLGHGIISSLRM